MHAMGAYDGTEVQVVFELGEWSAARLDCFTPEKVFWYPGTRCIRVPWIPEPILMLRRRVKPLALPDIEQQILNVQSLYGLNYPDS
jgi:hypothetical protein